MSTAIAKNFQIGADSTPSNNFTLYQPASPDGTLRLGNGNTGTTSSLLTLTSAGSLNFGGTAVRITGDFTNATIANRVMFQTSTANGSTSVSAIPSGTNTQSDFFAFNAADPNNASLLLMRAGAAETTLRSAITGTGSYLPMTFYTGGSERMRLDTSGNLGIGTTVPGARLQVDVPQSASVANLLTLRDASAGVTFNLQTFADPSFGTSNRFNYDGGYLAFRRSGTEQMRIDSAGNVGIGTSSPLNLLTVQTAATGTTAGSNVIARFQSNAAGRDATLQLSDNVANSATISMVGGAVAVAQNGVERTRIDTSGNFQFNSGYGSVATAYGCRAWVNFNGTGTVAIRASGNVSSITDNAVGDYTVNFTTAMPDANSSVNVTCQRMDVTTFEATYSGIRSNTSSNITTTSVRVYTAFSTTAGFDAGQVCVAVFR